MSIRNLTGLAVLLTAFAAPSHAALLGTTVAGQYYLPSLDDPYPDATLAPTVVGAGVEWTGSFVGGLMNAVDVGDDYLAFGFTGLDAGEVWNDEARVEFNGWRFDFEDGVLASVSGVTFAPNAYGYVDSMLALAGDSLFIDWQGAFLPPAEVITVRFSFAPAPVPEPGTLALAGLGLAGLVAARKRRA